MKHLWEVDHDYYCSDSNYYSRETDQEYDSWSNFFSEWGNADEDMNLVFRWDWNETEYGDELSIFIIGQRRGLFVPITISVDKSDESAVVEWLKPRFLKLKSLWQPLEEESL